VLKSILTFGLTRRAVILLGLLVFIGAGLVAFSRLNIEAYPNPAPVILEITAQAPGLSAEEMERYYTIPMEVGLYTTPGVDNIRSTSFYGLTFVRVTFKYGIDYYFAYTQAQMQLQQNVSLPGGQIPQIQQSSLVGEIFRYQIVGPPHFGLTNLRTVQDWIVTRRLFTVPGVVFMPGGPPIDFSCPNCGALYKVVRVLKLETNQPDYQDVHCAHCKRPLSGTDDRFLLKYFMVQKPHGKSNARRSS
jgi:heavy metal efflux system protein